MGSFDGGGGGGGGGGVPARWMHCPRKASTLIGGKFMAFKTPLGDKYDHLVPEENRFPPKMLFSALKNAKIKIGLWIDLTNTDRFYDKKEVEAHECKYVKINCRGHGETPSEEQTKVFVNVVSHFVRNNPLHSIGVHCTHGFNRTGFLIVSYLVEATDWSVEAGLREFARARAPGIYKADYIAELYRRYDDVEDTPMPPDLPAWHTESDDAPRGPPSNGRGRAGATKDAFVPGVESLEHFTEQPRLAQLQKKVQVMCERSGGGFPGSQPVSMDNSNLHLLHDKPYRVSWKADGTRYLMLVDGFDEVYLFDRDNCAFRVRGMRFPRRKNPSTHLENTLVDGEMVIDKVEGQDIPRFLCYDIIKIDGISVGKSEFYPIRLQCIESEIIGPRHRAMTEGKINKANEPFSVRIKQFWDLSQTASLLGEKFAKTLCHEPDGLIFQPSKEPYVAGRCDDVLKWKPSSHNSVDFKLKIVREEGEGILPRKIGQLYVGQLDRPFSFISINKTLKDLDNKIIECKFDKNAWVFMRERTDKSFPNSYTTATAVCNTIKDPVTQEKLLSFIDLHRFYDDSERMPPPAKRLRPN